MNINTYLQRKYDVLTPTTMLAVEARIFGIPYPLTAGWLDEYGNCAIRLSQANRLYEKLSARDDKFSARAREVLLEVMHGEI